MNSLGANTIIVVGTLSHASWAIAINDGAMYNEEHKLTIILSAPKSFDHASLP